VSRLCRAGAQPGNVGLLRVRHGRRRRKQLRFLQLLQLRQLRSLTDLSLWTQGRQTITGVFSFLGERL